MARTSTDQMRRALLAASPFAIALAIGSCAPKNGSKNGGAPSASPGASVAPGVPAWAGEARALLAVGIGAGRPMWNEPPLGIGESVTWLVNTEPPGPLKHVVVTRFADRIEVTRGLAKNADVTVEVMLTGSGATASVSSVAWTPRGGKRAAARSEDLAAIAPPPFMVDVPEGGNEVVRVPLGTFRARHAVVDRGGAAWHLYVSRSVPGGLLKLEEFPEGASSARMVMELEEAVRAKAPPP